MRLLGPAGVFHRSLVVALSLVSPSALASPIALPDLVSVLESTPEGGWVRVNQNTYKEVWAPPDLRALRSGANAQPYAIIRAWSSFTWDTNRGDLLLFGGGHGNYAGNEVYRWRATTGMWERASLPSEVDLVPFDTVNVRTRSHHIPIDGAMNAPQSAHTYDNTIFLPTLDRMLTFGGASTNSGGPFFLKTGPTTVRPTGPYLFDPSRADPNKVGGTTGSHVQRVAPHPEIVGGEMWNNRDLYSRPGLVLPTGFADGTTGYAMENGKDVVYASSKKMLFKYTINDLADSSLDSWQVVGRVFSGCCHNAAGSYDPENNVFIRTGDATRQFAYWDLDLASPTNNNKIANPVDLSGGFVMDRRYGMDYDPIRGEMLLWKGGTDVWVLDYDANLANWTLEKRVSTSVEGPPPTLGALVSGGVLGKWKYVPNLDAFIGLESDTLGNIWLYKPFDWVNPLLNPPDLSAMYGSGSPDLSLLAVQAIAVATVPEPISLTLVMAALVLAWAGRRFRSTQPGRATRA